MNRYSYSPLTNTTEYVSFLQLFEAAARDIYGQDIQIIQNKSPVSNINFNMTVVSRDEHPREASRTVVDIHTKEYINRGREATDESIVRIDKAPKRNRYTFISTRGIDFGFGSEIGAKVMGLAVGGGSAIVNACFSNTLAYLNEDDFSFIYHQEEKISVPPGHSITAKITTHTIRYEQDYTLKFSVPRNCYVPLEFRTSCQQCWNCCCCSCKTVRGVLVSDIISRLPGYNGDDINNTASFTQRGTLSWVGGGCSVEKVQQEPLQDLIT